MNFIDVFNSAKDDVKNEMYPYLPFLCRKAKGQILEIGVDRGFSTAAFLLGLEKNGGHLFSIDVNPKCGELYNHLQWTFICKDSRNVGLSEIPSLDVLLIDGYHEHPIIDCDMSFAVKVKSGGCILMHDIVMEDVREVYHNFLKRTRLVHFELPGPWGLGVMYVP